MARLQEVLEVFGSFEGTEAATAEEAGEGGAQEAAAAAEEMAMEVEGEGEMLSEVRLPWLYLLWLYLLW